MDASSPLSGVRVIDFTRYLAGPYATMLLSDFGADVIKIERPGVGDESRSMNPMLNGVSYPSSLVNRGKRSLTVDLQTAKGRDVALTLILQADVVVENFRPGVLEKFGLDYARIASLNPELVYCSISGFGQFGPNRHRPGFDIITQGMAGHMRMTGAPGGEPAKMGIAVNDLATGIHASNAILAAYIHRLRSGHGQYIDIALLDVGLTLTVWEAGAWFGAGEEAAANGTRHRLNAPYQAFRTSDGYVTVGANNRKLWELFCAQVISRPDLIDRTEYRDDRVRAANADQLEEELAPLFEAQPTDAWTVALDRAGVPGGPVYSYSEALAQEQVGARGLLQDVVHPTAGPMKTFANPARMSKTPADVVRPAPRLAEHSVAVLREAGLADEVIAELLQDGVVTDMRPSDGAQ